MKNPKFLCFPVSFTKEDVEHCFNCMKLVDYLLDFDTDGEPSSISVEDVKYLESLLLLHYNTMCEVIEASEGSDNDI